MSTAEAMKECRKGKAITIGLPGGRQILVSEYVRSWRVLKTLPANKWIERWGDWGAPAGQILCDMAAGIHDRINYHIPWHNRGRKWKSEWQDETLRAASQLNHPRLRIYHLPAWLKSRFADRLCTDND